MRILCVCDQGVSRSPTIAALLQYRGHETLSVGVEQSTAHTRALLSDWCDLAILTDPAQVEAFPRLAHDQIQMWPIGDHYPRPFNLDLRKLVLELADKGGL